jgi:multisubunit Na+/H+ antiporter MnhG subunit
MEEHGRFDDQAATMPLAREQTGFEPARQAAAPSRTSGYGRPSAGTGTGETRPFLLTSEFGGVLCAIVGVAITAAVMANLGARLAWILIAALVFGYTISRGLAKAATPSHAADPRERLLDDRATAHDSETTPGYGPWGVLGEYVRRGNAGRSGETRPFFETSEFVATALAIVAVAITAAAMSNVNARLAWILISALVFTYAVSRGLAKAGTASHAFDPRERLLGDGSAGGGRVASGASRPSSTETRPFLLTSEFIGTALAIIAIAICAAALDSLNAPLTLILITAMTCGYVLSRGIAKIATRSSATDPREALLERMADGDSRERETSQR